MKLRKEHKIGLVVALALAGLIWGVPFLKGSGIFTNQKRIYAVYQQVDGVTPSNPVSINGLNIGQVEKMGFMPDRSGRIIITMLIDGKVFIPRNSIAKIISTDLLGSKGIQLIFSNETDCVKDKDTLRSDLEMSLKDEVNRQLGPIKDKAERILTAVDSVMGALQKVFSNKSKNGLPKGFESIGNTLTNIEQISGNLNQLVGAEKTRLSDIFANVESISKNLKNNGEKISKTIQNMEQISDSLAKAHFISTINHTNNVVAQLQQTLEKINNGKGSLGLLLNDDKLYSNLNRSSNDLDSLLIDMKGNPHRYMNFSVFGGKKVDKSKKKKK